MILGSLRNAFLVLASLLAISACESRTPPENAKPGALYPRKEDIYVRAGQSFSLAEFYSLQEAYPTLAPADVLRLSVLSRIALQDRSRKQETTSLVEMTQIIRTFLPPLPTEKNDAATELRIRALFNVGSRKELRDRLEKSLQSEPTQWNPPLLKEIRVEKTPWG